MHHLLEFILETLLEGCVPRGESPVMRFFVMLTMGVAGIFFMDFAGWAVVQTIHSRLEIVIAIPIVLILVALSALSFWLLVRAKLR